MVLTSMVIEFFPSTVWNSDLFNFVIVNGII